VYKGSGGRGAYAGQRAADAREKKVIQEVVKGELGKQGAAESLGVTYRSVNRYLQRFVEKGPEGLYDARHSNWRRIGREVEQQIIEAKLKGVHRSARLIRDLLGLKVHEETVRRDLVRHHLERIHIPPVKPIRRFVAAEPNDLWRVDIQGKVRFPLIGDLPYGVLNQTNQRRIPHRSDHSAGHRYRTDHP